MDSASDFYSGGCGFESRRGWGVRLLFDTSTTIHTCRRKHWRRPQQNPHMSTKGPLEIHIHHTTNINGHYCRHPVTPTYCILENVLKSIQWSNSITHTHTLFLSLCLSRSFYCYHLFDHRHKTKTRTKYQTSFGIRDVERWWLLNQVDSVHERPNETQQRDKWHGYLIAYLQLNELT